MFVFSCPSASHVDHSSKGASEMSREVRNWRRVPTAFGNRSAFTMWGEDLGRVGAQVYLDLGVESAEPKVIRAPL